MARGKAAAAAVVAPTSSNGNGVVDLPTTATQANAFVAECLVQWEQGGKDRMHGVVKAAFMAGLEAEAGPSSLRTDAVLLMGHGAAAFNALVHALFLRHALRPQLVVSAFSSLLHDVVPQVEDEEAQDHGLDDAGPSRAVSPSTEGHSPDVVKRRLLADSIIDAVWTVDDELDSQRELAAAHSLTALSSSIDSQTAATIDDQLALARSRLADIVRDLLSKGVISRLLASERLEMPLLVAVGLVRDKVSFNKRAIQIRTATYYKQQKFNLLREENEGYSGLVNELLGSMGPSIATVVNEQGVASIVEQEDASERNKRARTVVSNAKALIGYFDLDPNRVLDILLDVFASNVVHHWPFFLAVLTSSAWGGSVKSQDGNISTDMDIDRDASSHPLSSDKLGIDSDAGNHTIAQILGFKFSHYQSQDVTDKVPEELYLLAAILIRAGHVRLADLYGHLSPDEKGMTALHEKYKTAISDRANSVRGNALSMAAPLTADDAAAGASTLSDTKDGDAKKLDAANAKEPPNQILGLLDALLSIGQLKHSLVVLGRYPWLCSAYPHTADLYARLLNVIIEPAYQAVSLTAQHEVLQNVSTPAPRLRFDVKQRRLVPTSARQWRVTACAPEPLATASSSFLYFFAHWKRDLPACEAGKFLQVFVPLLRVLGINLWRSPTLFQKICRLGKVAMRAAILRNEDRTGWLEVVRNFLLPTLSMTSGNSGLVSEVWVMLRHLPYTERYGLYGEWKHSLYRRPELKVRQAETEKEAKGILKRISSDNVKLSGRSLAKASHANPTIFFTVALNQVQSYSNLIAPIVECAKYLTHFEYDVFGFNLIDALSNPEKDRTKQDGTSVSLWLQSLAAFTGTLYRRYAMMDCSAVLQYVANTLKENNLKDLVLVRELVLKMAGIEPLANLSDAQVAALSGGRLLHMEAMMVANAGITTPARAQLRRSGARLLQALTQSRMIMPLLILIAQQRQACVHLVPESEAHLKYLGNLFDTSQEILFQYVEFMHNQLEPQAYADIVPSLEDLCRRFEIEPAIAFHIVRPRLALRMRADEAKMESERLRNELLASMSQSKAKSSSPAEADTEASAIPAEGEQDPAEFTAGDTLLHDAETLADAKVKLEDVVMDESAEPEGDVAAVPGDAKDAHPSDALVEATTAAESCLPDEVKQVLGTSFYATFWQMALSDISVPRKRYEEEIKGLQRVIDDNPEVRRVVPKARSQAQDLIKQLRNELKEQELIHKAALKRLETGKAIWFADTSSRSEIVYQLAQHCLLPRALLSPTDAIFAGRFLRHMHTLGTRNFASLTAYDRILMEVVGPVTFSSTENEARNFARFLHTVLGDLNSWFRDEKRYTTEALGDNLPGFQMRWVDRHGGETIPPSDILTHLKFKQVTEKWHSMLRSTFRECLLSREYMRIRNTIVIMTRIASFFPMWEAHGTELLDSVSTVANEEERGDLKILGQGLLATLKKEAKSWIPTPANIKKAAAAQQAAASVAKTESTTAKPEATRTKEIAAHESKSRRATPDGAADVKPPTPARTASSSALPARPSNGSRLSSRPDRATPPRSAASQALPTEDTRASSVEAERVAAARKAALASMKEGAMNPPKAPSSTSDRQGSAAATANDVPVRADKANQLSAPEPPVRGSSRTPSSRSRATSPSAQGDRHDEAPKSRQGSRAPAEGADARRGERGTRDDPRRDAERARLDREREADKYRSERESQRNARDRPSERSRDDRDRARERERDAFRPQERDYGAARGQGQERPRSQRDEQIARDGTARNGGREAPVRGARGDGRETPHNGGAAEADRGVNDMTGPRGDGRSASRQASARTADNPRDAANYERQEGRPSRQEEYAARDERRAQSDMRQVSGQRGEAVAKEADKAAPAEPLSPGGSKKRSLADRLSVSERSAPPASPSEASRNGPISAREEDARRSAQDEPSNKRARTSRGPRENDTRSPYHDPREDYHNDGPRRTSSSAAAEMGISIQGQGQGRGSGMPAYSRRDSGRADDRAGTGYDQRELLSAPRGGAQARGPLDDYGKGPAASSGGSREQRQASGSSRVDRRGDRGQRRRERRSGA